MSTLHTVNKSPFAHQALASCLRACQTGDAILLLEDGVIGALPHSLILQESARDIDIYALEADLLARGLLSRISPNIQVISYDDFVALACTHKNSISWY